MQTDASNVTLPSLFANKCFRIPNYQRGYAWGEPQLKILCSDSIKKFRIHIRILYKASSLVK